MSSKRRIRRRACAAKKRFPDSAAGFAAVRTLHQRKGYSGRMNVYHCQFCGGYHVGHG